MTSVVVGSSGWLGETQRSPEAEMNSLACIEEDSGLRPFRWGCKVRMIADLDNRSDT
jgi:hypothetical protein